MYDLFFVHILKVVLVVARLQLMILEEYQPSADTLKVVNDSLDDSQHLIDEFLTLKEGKNQVGAKEYKN